MSDFDMSNVAHPKHYTAIGVIEPIDYIEDKQLNFNLGNAIKYISRCNYKGKKEEDLRKAIYFIERELGMHVGSAYELIKNNNRGE